MLPVEMRTLILFLSIHVAGVTSPCLYKGSPYRTVNETAGPRDGVLYTIVATNASVIMDAIVHVKGHQVSFDEYFSPDTTTLRNGSDLFELSLSKVINLDWARDLPRQRNGGVVIWVLLMCHNRNPPYDGSGNYSFLTVLPVDNYPPEIKPNTTIYVREDVALEHGFTYLGNAVHDRDYPDYTTFTAFTIIRNPSNKLDGSDVFSVSSSGYLSTTARQDYETGKRFYQLKISVRNNVNQTANGIVNIKVLNVNDNRVLFVYRGCVSDCSYSLYSYGSNQDTVIRATDADNDTIEYSIVSVSPAIETGIMVINKTTGTIRQIAHPTTRNLRSLTLKIKAKANSSLPDARIRLPTNINEDFAIVRIYFDDHRFSVSGSNRVLDNGLSLLGCLVMTYRLFNRVI